jgi:hypothetical protein
MKNKSNKNLIFVIIIIIAVLILFKVNTVNNSNKQFVEKEKSGTSLGSNLGAETNQSIQNKINLCEKITPYVGVFNLQNLCVANGGMWVCNSDNIGCYTLTSPLIDCNLAVVKTALSQCTSATGKPYCDTQTVSCKY